MQIIKSTVTKLVIDDLMNMPYRLDPITVYAEDLGPNQGKLTVECYGKAWSAYWGGMGSTLAEFIRWIDVDYLVNRLGDNLPATKYDSSSAAVELKKIVLKRRRQLDNWYTGEQDWNYESLHKAAARELWDRIDSESFADDPAWNSTLIQDVTGHEEWWLHIPEAPNPEYQYLTRIATAVKDAFARLSTEKETSCPSNA